MCISGILVEVGVAVDIPLSSRILVDNVDSGKMYGSDATRHQDLVDEDELPSSGRGPLGNENEAIATPPPNTTDTHGSSSSSSSWSSTTPVGDEPSFFSPLLLLLLLLQQLTVTIISCSK